MQTKDIDTYEACNVLGLEEDARDFSDIAKILNKLKIKTIEMASNNPRKVKGLAENGIEVKYIPQKLITHYTHQNIPYLVSKQSKGNHKNLVINEEYLIENYPYSEKKIEFYQKEDKYGGFSNFSNHPFFLDNKYWRTSEHYYQANKFRRNSKIYNQIQQTKLAMDTKSIAYSIETDYKDWDNKKILFMHNALIAKFRQNSNLLQELINTDNSYIVENAEDDYYWGCGLDKSGKNILGRVLMFVRDECKNKS